MHRTGYQNRGFTLIELIIVIAVLAILAGAAIPTYAGVMSRSRSSADLFTLSTLNKATAVYRYEVSHGQADVFYGFNSDEARIEELKDKGFVTGETTPQSRNASFDWSIELQVWTYSNPKMEDIPVADAVLETFKAAMDRSLLDHDVYLSKKTAFNWGSGSKYNPGSWNGYLEKILEAGDVISDKRDPAKEGSNTIGYENPFSTSEKKGTIINLPNKGTLNSLYKSSPGYFPPAIMITKESELAYDSTDPYISDNLDKLKGTMILYKSDKMSNDQVQIYYIKEDGSKSELIPLKDIFG